MVSTNVPSSPRKTSILSAGDAIKNSVATRPSGATTQLKTRNSSSDINTSGLQTAVNKFINKANAFGKKIAETVLNTPKEIDNGYHRFLNVGRWSEGQRSDKEERSKGQTPLSDDLNIFAKYSPTVAANLKEKDEKGWHVRYGLPGQGSHAEISLREIVVDPKHRGNKKKLAVEVGHELGHMVRPPPKIDRLTLQSRLTSMEVTETAAVLNSIKIHHELKKTKPELTGDGGEISRYFSLYQKGYDQYMKDPTEEGFQKAQKIIGPVFMNKEISSADPSAKSYKESITKEFRGAFPGRF